MTHHLLLAAAAFVAAHANAEPLSNAGLLCMLMDNTRSVAPCSISEARHTVTINIRLHGETADQVCARLQAALSGQRVFFDGARWRLDITASTDRSRVVASCDLPQTPK